MSNALEIATVLHDFERNYKDVQIIGIYTTKIGYLFEDSNHNCYEYLFKTEKFTKY